jgi:hypothetical protein
MTDRRPASVSAAVRCAAITVTAGLILSAGAANAQSLDGVARTVSAIIAVKSACGKIMAVDQEKLTKYGSGIIHHGKELYGNDQFSRALAADIERRRAEVDVTGAPQWCNYQRAYFDKLGLTGVFLN